MVCLPETIFALSTGMGKAAVAIVRVSGPKCDDILQTICRRTVWPDRTAVYTEIFDLEGRLLDKGIVLYFRSPRSFTGEDMVEFQITGGRAVKVALLTALNDMPGARPAEAGEFARRAFENGKLDLLQVEGLAAIVDAETAAQTRNSALMAFGTVSRQCEEARAQLLTAAALVAGILDFSDVEDPDGTTIESINVKLRLARSTLLTLYRNSRMTERLRDGYGVAVVGVPNAGKSTLINYILQREAAIVSDIPGTTRDYLEFFVELSGFPVMFVDTAGFRVAVDPIERLGIERSRDRIRAVDLIVWLSESEHDACDYLPTEVPTIKVRSKQDMSSIELSSSGVFFISARTGQGVDLLISEVAARAGAFFADSGAAGLGTERQLEAARGAIDAIDRALTSVGHSEELLAEDIRAALMGIARVTGRVDVEDLLDEVFSRLCVGK